MTDIGSTVTDRDWSRRAKIPHPPGEGTETPRMSREDRLLLLEAKRNLDSPALAIRLANLVGTPIEKGIHHLPARFLQQIPNLTHHALDRSLRVALQTVPRDARWHTSTVAHRAGVMATGGLGGFFGLAGLALDLSISTTIMLRGIATIAREHGEDISRPEVRAACLEVFALGGPTPGDDGADGGFFAVKAALAKAIGAPGAAAPVAKLIAAVAKPFAIRVTEKAAAQALPIIGAVGGAAINGAFMAHFQTMAQGHFTVRRLEQKYGPAVVKEAYRSSPA